MSNTTISLPDLGVLNNFINTFTNTINTGYSSITPEVQFVTATIITIVITMTGAFIAFDDDGMMGFWRKFPLKLIEIGFVLLLIEKWQYLTDAIGFSLGKLGLVAAGSTQSVTAFLQDPITIVTDGFNLFSGLMETANNIPIGITTLNHLPEVLGYGVSAILIQVGYIIIAGEVFITFIEFKIINLAALIFVPFSLIKPLAHLSHGAYNSAFKFGAKFLVMAIIVSLGMNFINQLIVNPDPDLGNLVSIATFTVIFLLLALKLPNLAAGLISGSPNLSGGALAAAATNVAAGAAAYGGAKAIAALRGDKPDGGGGSDLEKMKRAAGAGVGSSPSPLSQMAKSATAGQGGGVNGTGNSGSDGEAGT